MQTPWKETSTEMMTGKTLPELAAELERQAVAKKDFLAPVGRFAIRCTDAAMLVLDFEEGGEFLISETAHAQLADYLSIPMAFYRTLLEGISEYRVALIETSDQADEREGGEEDTTGDSEVIKTHALFEIVVNCLLRKKVGEKRFIRTLDGQVRAILSQSFNPDLDHLDVYCVLAGVMKEIKLPPENVLSAEVTATRLTIKVSTPGLRAEVTEGDIVEAGFILTNSEVGAGTLSVQQYVTRLLCRNGLVKNSIVRHRHIGKMLEADEDGAIYRDDTRRAEANLRLLQIRDHVKDALSEERFHQLVGLMRGSTEVKLAGKLEDVVEVVSNKYGLTTLEGGFVYDNLIKGADFTLWGLTNAVTATASQVGDYDRGTELETVGGKLLSLSTDEIKVITNGAEPS
jgi:hypothetical protein